MLLALFFQLPPMVRIMSKKKQREFRFAPEEEAGSGKENKITLMYAFSFPILFVILIMLRMIYLWTGGISKDFLYTMDAAILIVVSWSSIAVDRYLRK